MRNKFLALIVVLIIAFSCTFVQAAYEDCDEILEVTESISENVEQIVVKKNKNIKKKKNVEKFTKIKSKFLLSENYDDSEVIYSSIEQINVVNESGTNEISSQSINNEWSDNEGYLTIYTSAYKIGNEQSDSGKIYPVYHIEGKVVMSKTFKLRYQDQLIIRHSSSGAFYTGCETTGLQKYKTITSSNNPYVGQKTVYNNVENKLTALFSNPGVNYKFKFPEDYGNSSTGGGVTVSSSFSAYN